VLKMKTKSKTAIICLLFLFVFLWPISFFDLLLFDKENNNSVKTANGSPVEGIINGGFETGDLTGWVTGGPYPAMVGTGEYLAHTGTYGCKISGYSGGTYRHSWIEKHLIFDYIYSDNIDSFSFWRKTDKIVRVTVIYWDNTNTTHDFYNLFLTWEQHNITGLTPGKRLKKVRFETLVDGHAVGGIDDITMTYRRVIWIKEQGIFNGDFETGDLTSWVTGGPYPAMVGTGPNLTHSGTYGCNISGYSGGTYRHSWIEQDLTHTTIYAGNIISFSFWRKTGKTVRVTVTYWDDTNTTHNFYNLFLTWEQHNITGLTPGKRLKKVRFETLIDGVSVGGIDDISLTYKPIVSEGIINGGFETGDLTGWVTGGPYPAMVGTGGYLAHSGTYGCKISGYSGGTYRHSWIEQDLTNLFIYSDLVKSFSFWKWTSKIVRVTVTYWDNTNTTHDFLEPTVEWAQHYITGLTPGKRLKKLRFETLVDGSIIGGIDDITMTYSKVLWVQKEGISNGDFETGDLTGWVTGGPYPAMVGTGEYLAHSGTYGCKISGYSGGTYRHSWIEQNLTTSYICSDLIESFSFWRRTDKIVRVTVTYWDNTNTTHEFFGAFPWEQHNITGLTPGKRLKKLRFETLVDGVGIGGIDDLTMTYNITSIEPETPILSNISPDPDFDGDITLDWNDVNFYEYYTIYRSSSLITELDSSVTTLGNTNESTFTDIDLYEGKYYYVVRAWNDWGYSELSNCESVEVDLPLPDAPILEEITPNPDPNGDITLDWNDVSNADNYTIYRYSSFITELNGSVETLDTVFTSTYTDFDLDEGIYYYVVIATNGTGNSYISKCESVEVDLPGPAAPFLEEITPNPDPNGDITLDWNDVSNADNYTIYRYSSFITELNGSVETLDTVFTSTYTDFDLDEGIYYYVVTATNETGTSEISNCKSIEVDLPGPAAPILEEITPNPDPDGDITLIWNNVPTASLYYIYRYNKPIFEYNDTLDFLGTTSYSFFVDLNLENGKYYYVIIAENATGLSDISNCESVEVVLSGPAAPILEEITPNPDPDGDITLIWNNVPTADLYYVYRSDNIILSYNDNLTLLGTTVHTTYEDLDLEDGRYYYVIIAENENGVSEVSNCESVQVNIKGSEPDVPGYSLGLILVMMVSFLAIIYYQKFRPKKNN
jgi:fibronectin type 3 domain-containing protein